MKILRHCTLDSVVFLSFSRFRTDVKVFHVVPGTQKSDTRLYRNIKISINTQCSIELHTFQVFCCVCVNVFLNELTIPVSMCATRLDLLSVFSLSLALPCLALLYRLQKIHFQTISLCDNANWLDKHHSIIDAWINVLFSTLLRDQTIYALLFYDWNMHSAQCTHWLHEIVFAIFKEFLANWLKLLTKFPF